MPDMPAPGFTDDKKKKLMEMADEFDKNVGNAPPAKDMPMGGAPGPEALPEKEDEEGKSEEVEEKSEEVEEGGEDKDLPVFLKITKLTPDTGKVLLAYVKTDPKFEGKAVNEIATMLANEPNLMMKMLQAAFPTEDEANMAPVEMKYGASMNEE